MLSHLADCPEGGPVGIAALIRACAWGDYLETHARRLYAQILSPDLAAAIELDKHLVKGDLPARFTAKEVYRRHWRGLDHESTAPALRLLEDYDRVRSVRTTGGGRPTTLYLINPKIRGRV